MNQPMFSERSPATRIEADVPGATVSIEDADGVLIERNGAGSIVARTYPTGLEDEYADETPTERVNRLTDELKAAKAALRRSSR